MVDISQMNSALEQLKSTESNKEKRQLLNYIISSVKGYIEKEMELSPELKAEVLNNPIFAEEPKLVMAENLGIKITDSGLYINSSLPVPTDELADRAAKLNGQKDLTPKMKMHLVKDVETGDYIYGTEITRNVDDVHTIITNEETYADLGTNSYKKESESMITDTSNSEMRDVFATSGEFKEKLGIKYVDDKEYKIFNKSTVLIEKKENLNNVEQLASDIVEQMAQGADVLGENQNQQQISSGRQMGFSRPWILVLLTLVLVCATVLLMYIITK